MNARHPANPISEKITPAARWATIACGWVVLAYAVGLTLEILGRKFFATSFKGIDELGGFVLAISAAIGASYAMAQRSHTRVDVFLVRFPAGVQRWLNTLAMVAFAGFSGFAVWRGVAVLRDTLEFGSTATNLEQPLWVPQALWVAGLALLALISLAYALHAVFLLATRRPELNAWYGPPGAQEELDAELANLQARGVDAEALPTHRPR
ncbi:MAG: TRAP transporter small permease [Hydrogenophaga sp.]|uniref:TRAP transporter small permease n=1 Tax=Hydrogenophaga sp. TaxID=1904254 RepID=UPI003D9BC4C1